MPLWVRWGTRVLALILPCSTVLASPPPRAAYVLSSNDAQITRVDLDTGSVRGGLATVGALANRIEVDGRERLAVVVSSGSDAVTLFDLRTESVAGTVLLPSGSNPWAAEIVGGRVFVSCLLTDRIYEVDPSDAAIVDSAFTGRGPEGMASGAGKLYVANTGFDFGTFSYEPGTVTVLHLDGLDEIATVPVGLNPQDVIRAPEGELHVLCTGDFGAIAGRIDVIDGRRDRVTASLPVAGFPGGIAMSRGGTAYLNLTTPTFASEIWAYDARTRELVHDGSDPLLPSFDFYGEPAVTRSGQLLVPSFTRDLLLVEDPASPGAPTAHFVGDGPIDVAIVERGPAIAATVSEEVAHPLRSAGSVGSGRLAFAAVRPNPSRGPVSFELAVPRPGGLVLELFDVTGRRVARLGSTAAAADIATLAWDGRDESGQPVGPGLYFARAQVAGETAVERVLRLR